jgi:hypothetical protein
LRAIATPQQAALDGAAASQAEKCTPVIPTA